MKIVSTISSDKIETLRNNPGKLLLNQCFKQPNSREPNEDK